MIALFSIPIILVFFLGLIFYLNRRVLINDLNKVYEKGLKMLADAKSYSEKNALVLQAECTELFNYLIDFEKLLKNRTSISELQKLISEKGEELVDFEGKIETKKKKWEDYNQFKSSVDFIKIEINNKIIDIKKKGQLIIEDKQECEEIINKKIQEGVSILNNLLKEYETLEKATFNEFNFYILEEIEKEYSQAFEKADRIIDEMKLFDKNVKVYLDGLKRKSTYYVTLEELIDGRRIKNRIGEIVVSYKTYKNAHEGKRYKKDTFITGKRIVSTQTIDFRIEIADKSFLISQDLNDEEFTEIFLELPLDKNNLTIGEDGIPLELNLKGLDLVLCEKEKESFTVNYYLKFIEEKNLITLINELNLDGQAKEPVKLI